MREVSKKNYSVIVKAIDFWESNGIVDGDAASRMRDSIRPIPFDWRKAARLLIVAALCCFIVGAAALTHVEWFVRLLMYLFGGKAIVKSVLLAFLAAVFYFWGNRRKRLAPEKYFTNESILFLGVACTASAITWLGVAINDGSGHFSLLVGLAAVIYGLLAIFFDSVLIWIFAVLSLAGWFGAETGYASGWGMYWLGLNYPLRFTIFGAALTALAKLMERSARFLTFQRATLSLGLLFLFTSLWIMSIFGNYGSIDSWYKSSSMELLHWSVLFAAAAGVALWLGIKRDDAMLRGYGIVFLAINIYTRYFETFWNSMNKAAFFLILGASFWLLGSRAEKIWNIRRSADDDDDAE